MWLNHLSFLLQLNVDDQILLLKSCCMEIMCLRAACRYNPEQQTLTLHNGLVLNKSQLNTGGLGLLVEPIFEFAMGLSKLHLDNTEIALLAAVLLMQSGTSSLCVWVCCDVIVMCLCMFRRHHYGCVVASTAICHYLYVCVCVWGGGGYILVQVFLKLTLTY